jgi:hypothetical protein
LAAFEYPPGPRFVEAGDADDAVLEDTIIPPALIGTLNRFDLLSRVKPIS